MELVIGNKKFDTVKLTADFPIKFYKETGYDVFSFFDEGVTNPLKNYELMLNLAYHLTGKKVDSIDLFAEQFTPMDFIQSYENIMAVYVQTTKNEVESKTEKK